MPEAKSETPQSRAERRRELVKNSRHTTMKKYQRNKREMQIIKSVSAVLALAVILGLGYAGFNFLNDRDLSREPEGVSVYAYAGSNHIDGDIDYSAQPDYKGEIPPAGGAHNNVWQTCQVYEQPIRQENAVHSMEHGAVWITYQPTLSADQIASLKDMVEGDGYMLMSPYTNLPAPIVLTAWNHQLQLQTFDKDTIERFIRSYKTKRGVTPELGASCVGTDATVAQ